MIFLPLHVGDIFPERSRAGMSSFKFQVRREGGREGESEGRRKKSKKE
jgi:hypothetical protein